MFSRAMYCQTSSSVQLEMGKTRKCSPDCRRVLNSVHSSGRWFFGVPLPEVVPVREEPLLRPGLFLVPPRPADARVEGVFLDGAQQRRGLQAVAACVDPGLFLHQPVVDGLLDAADEEANPKPLHERVPERQGFREVVPRVDVHQGHRDPRRREGFRRQVRHHNAVLPSA